MAERMYEYEGAEQKSYHRFVRPIEHVSDEEVARIKGLVGQDPSLPPAFHDRAIIQTDAYTPVPEGVYLMRDGTLFISAVTPAPNITGESADWWMVWHQLDPLRYHIWNPEDHYGVKVTDADRARILDEGLPIRERGWGITSTVLESMNGEEPTWSDLCLADPGSVGMLPELIGARRCKAMVVANNVSRLGPLEIPVFMCEWLRENDEGANEWVVAAWMGHGVRDGEDWQIRIPTPLRRKMAGGFPSMFIVHNHKEIGHLNEVLPELFAQEGGKPLGEGQEVELTRNA